MADGSEECLRDVIAKSKIDANLAGRVATIEALVLNLTREVQTNNRILLLVVCVIAAGEKVLEVIK